MTSLKHVRSLSRHALGRAEQEDSSGWMSLAGQPLDQIDARHSLTQPQIEQPTGQRDADAVRRRQVRLTQNPSEDRIASGGDDELRIHRHDVVQMRLRGSQPALDDRQRIIEINRIDRHTEHDLSITVRHPVPFSSPRSFPPVG